MRETTATSEAMPEPDTATDSMSPEHAKKRVFDHWSRLEDLCSRRFPNNENLAHEGLMYVLEQLERDRWRRVRTWEGTGRFLTYLLTLSARLLTDFTRARFGHVRMPEWLAAKRDPLWQDAYRLLRVEGYKRHEAAEILRVRYPGREDWFVDQVVTSVNGRCRPQARSTEAAVSMDDSAELVSSDSTPEQHLEVNDSEFLEAICELLGARADGRPPPPRSVGELVDRLRPHVRLTEEERMFLRLRHIDGLKMKEIVKLLALTGDAYKRYHKILSSLRDACRQAGLIELGEAG